MKAGALTPCTLCGRGLMEDRTILFTRVRVTRLGVDLPAARRQIGLEEFMGSHTLARVMGPNEDIAKPLAPEETLCVCDRCAMGRTIAELWERTSPRPAAAGGGT